jgi:hypothetical protein
MEAASGPAAVGGLDLIWDLFGHQPQPKQQRKGHQKIRRARNPDRRG